MGVDLKPKGPLHRSCGGHVGLRRNLGNIIFYNGHFGCRKFDQLH